MFSFGLHDAQALKKAFPSPPSNSVTDEEVQKRSTDCIYFLASPLTCKKGNNCEYRHSEAARVNPRDCRFWKAGNCLNPCCTFRHLPLDAQSPSAVSIASTSSASIASQLVPATSSFHKSRTPCYFFSQGYCSKNDKCPFMHLSGGGGALPKALAAENSNTVLISERELSIPPQIASMDGKSVTSNGSHALSKVAGTSQKLPQNVRKLENSMASKGNGSLATFGAPHQCRPILQADRPSFNGDKSRLRQQTLQDKKGGGTFAQLADLTHSSNLCQENAWWEDQPAVKSDSNQSTKSLSNSVGSNGKDLHEPSRSDEELLEVVPPSRPFGGPLRVISTHVSGPKVDKHGGQRVSAEQRDASADLRNHLMKRQKKTSILDVLEKVESRGHAGMAIRGNGIQSLSEQRVKLFVKPVIKLGECSAAKSKGKESSLPLQRVSVNKSTNMSQDSIQGGAPAGTSKRELASFTGPKSLAQIKAEKMASASTLAGKDNSSTIPAQAFTKAKSIKVVNSGATLPKSICVGHTCGKQSNASISTGLASAKSVESKVETPSVEFEGPKPLSMLLKRKRELDTDKLVSTPSVTFESELFVRPKAGASMPDKAELSMPNKAERSMPLKAEVSTPDTCGELEGEVGNHGSKPDSNQSSSCPPKEEHEVMLSPRAGVEAGEDEMDSSEDGLISDTEMEDIGYDDADCGIDEEDDDDFAKELRRFFTSSN